VQLRYSWPLSVDVPDTNVSPRITSDHIERTIQAVAQLRADHHESATAIERAVDRTTAFLSRPWLLGVVTAIVVGWIGLNLLVIRNDFRPFDPPPFVWLEGAVSLVSLYMVLLVLAAQRREDQLAQRRELLILELAILGEQKTAKVIQLLEESRRDNPLIHDRVDHEADAMAQPADQQSVLEAITEIDVSTP
jgi:uncharacterized membrane protein